MSFSTEVLLDSVFGIHDESVAESGTVNVRTDGDELQHWISVCLGLSSSRSPRAPPGFVAEAKHHTLSIPDFFFFILNWESNKRREL